MSLPPEIVQIFFLIIILGISIGLHEYAHALSSFKLGDPTPKLQKRLTPNPLSHIDPLGFISIFIIHFGWGKPVQVNPAYYKKPLRDELIVSLAGPFTNFSLGVLGVLILVLYIKFSSFSGITEIGNSFFSSFRELFALINFALSIFNLLPVPPLDGFRLVKFFKPSLAQKILKYQMHIAIGFLLIIIFAPQTVGGFIRETIQLLFQTVRVLISSLLI